VTIPESGARRADFIRKNYARDACEARRRYRLAENCERRIGGAGVRRIEAVTASGRWNITSIRRRRCGKSLPGWNVGEDDVLATVEKLTSTARQLERN